jgi:hypothetical protein
MPSICIPRERLPASVRKSFEQGSGKITRQHFSRVRIYSHGLVTLCRRSC